MCFDTDGKVTTVLTHHDGTPGKAKSRSGVIFPLGRGSMEPPHVLEPGQGRRNLKTTAYRFLRYLLSVVYNYKTRKHSSQLLKFWWKQLFASNPKFLCFRKLRTVQKVLRMNPSLDFIFLERYLSCPLTAKTLIFKTPYT